MTPFSAGDRRPATVLPEHACDCHMHVFDASQSPVPGAALTPPTATIDDYRKLQARLGNSRHVLVQPSTYGTDNSLMVSVLRRHRDTTRGVAVIDDSVTDTELNALHAEGVVGIRFNQVQAGATTLQMLGSLAPRIAARGWHIQLHISGEQLLEAAGLLRRLNVPIVLDHYARLHKTPNLARTVEQCLWELMESGLVWLKLSAPYLSSQAKVPPYDDLAHFVLAITQQFPERLVWGTDWPHATEANKPDDAAMLDWLDDLLPCQKSRASIFAENPARLYGFQTQSSARDS